MTEKCPGDHQWTPERHCALCGEPQDYGMTLEAPALKLVPSMGLGSAPVVNVPPVLHDKIQQISALSGVPATTVINVLLAMATAHFK